MSEALDNARKQLLESIASGGVRDLNAPIVAIRKPEPSTHPDPRMQFTLADMKLTEPELDPPCSHLSDI